MAGNDGGAPGLNYSNFPNGIKISGYGPAAIYPLLGGSDYAVALGTIVVPAGAAGTAFGPTVGGQAFGSAIFALASPYGDNGAGTAFTSVLASVGAGGSVTLRGICQAGTASLASGTATYFVVGTF